MEMTMDQREAYSEVLEILRHMDNKYVAKIPKKLIMFFYDNCRLDYEFTLSTGLDKTPLKPKTIDILALLNASYWNKGIPKEELIIQYGLKEQLNNQLEKENKYTKIDVDSTENLPTSIGTAKKIFLTIKNLIIKIFGD